jgi:hypothetical protein
MLKPFVGTLVAGAIAVAVLGPSDPPKTITPTTIVRVAPNSPQTTTTTTTKPPMTTTTYVKHLPTTTTTDKPTHTAVAHKPQDVTSETFKHPEWIALASQVGWPESELDRLDHVIHRESRGEPTAWNRDDPMSGSRGLTQVNGFWCKKNRYEPNPAGFLGAAGVLDSCEDLFDPEINLRAALAMWEYGVQEHRCGWGPWQTKGFRPCK